MRVLDLFAGLGGFSLAAHSQGFQTAAFCEIDQYAQKVLRRHFPGVPIFDDVKELTADALADAECSRLVGDSAERGGGGEATPSQRPERHTPQHDGQSPQGRRDSRQRLILTAGFPCQDISYAGKGAGLAGERSGLFSEVARLTDELRPDYVLLENVAALLTRGLDAVLGTLASLGYDAWWSCIPACAVGAPHRRDRVWIVAVPTGDNEARFRAFHAHVISRLTPFGDDAWTTPIANEAEKRGNHNEGLRGQAARGETWPTPNAWDGDRGPDYARAGREGSGGDDLVTLACKDNGTTGSLNPSWVETLMGYPIGYTLPDGDPMRSLPDRWPAGLGAEQHEWEPPRLTTEKLHRASRLKALGNSIVPAVAVVLMEAIAADRSSR